MVLPIAPAASPLLAPLSAPILGAADDGVGGAEPGPQRATAALGVRSVRLDLAALTAVQARGDADSVSPEDQRVIAELKARDREVRRHEAAHARAGGEFAGTPHYEFTRGPDGRAYAVGGTTPIDVNPVAGNPEATIEKMQTVKRAALAPAEPSAQDRAVAASAEAEEAKARRELRQQNATEDGAQAGRGRPPAGSLVSLFA
jgi:hypothetical protein